MKEKDADNLKDRPRKKNILKELQKKIKGTKEKDADSLKDRQRKKNRLKEGKRKMQII